MMYSTARLFVQTMMGIMTLLMLLTRIKALPLANMDDTQLLEQFPGQPHAVHARNVESCDMDHIYNLIKEACTSMQPMRRRRRDTRSELERMETVAELLDAENAIEDDDDAEGGAAVARRRRRQKRKALQEHLMDKCCSRRCTAHNFVSWCP